MMPSSRSSTQSGSALVIGLILLVVLTLMGISSMNTASLDLIMAGNEQYRGRGFQAAEAGIEQAIRNGPDDTSADYSSPVSSTGTGNDTYQYTTNRPFGNTLQDPPPGYTKGPGGFRAAYFVIQSTGTSERNSTAINRQEFADLVKSDGDPLTGGDCATTDLYSACP